MAEDGTPLAALLNPLTPVRLVVRALDDLHAVAGVAREDPNPTVALQETLDSARTDLDELTVRLRSLDTTLAALDGHAAEIVDGGRELTDTAKVLDGTGRRIHDGGRDLLAATRELDRHAAQLLAIARVFERHLPVAMRALGTVEELEDSLETVAETVEPLQGAAEKVGRVTKRLSRSSAER